jgi:uncharacterized repeat protein (TIGR04076 family)
MKQVRITVIKKGFDEKLIAEHLKPEAAQTFRPCDHAVGDAFVVDQPVMCPEGMCPWAWHDVESFVRIAAFEGKLDDHTPENSWIRCCTDAFRPVTFLIEPVEDS